MVRALAVSSPHLTVVDCTVGHESLTLLDECLYPLTQQFLPLMGAEYISPILDLVQLDDVFWPIEWEIRICVRKSRFLCLYHHHEKNTPRPTLCPRRMRNSQSRTKLPQQDPVKISQLTANTQKSELNKCSLLTSHRDLGWHVTHQNCQIRFMMQ